MALTFTRWVTLAGLACAAIAVALLPLPPGEMGHRFRPAESTRLQQVKGQLDRARDALRIARMQEQAMEVIRQSPLAAGAPPTVMELGAATADQRRAFADALHEWWPRELDDSIAVGIILGGDSADMEWRDRHLLPADTDGHTCITLVSTYTWYHIKRHSPSELQHRFASQLAPCALLAKFGRPGPHIERWLSGKGFDFATYFSPTGRSVPVEALPEDADPVAYVLFEMEWSLYGTMPLGVQCLNGRIAECASAVFSSRAASRPARAGFHTAAMPWRAPFGTLTRSYIADLYREIGPEAFRRFWTSDQPFDRALQEATGMSVGAWTHQWAVGRRAFFRAGPLPEQRSVIRVTGLALLLLGSAVIYSTRRSVR